jgi:hypothetical protein
VARQRRRLETPCGGESVRTKTSGFPTPPTSTAASGPGSAPACHRVGDTGSLIPCNVTVNVLSRIHKASHLPSCHAHVTAWGSPSLMSTDRAGLGGTDDHPGLVRRGIVRPFRADVRVTADVSGGIEQTVNLAEPDLVIGIVDDWLRGIRNPTRPGTGGLRIGMGSAHRPWAVSGGGPGDHLSATRLRGGVSTRARRLARR